MTSHHGRKSDGKTYMVNGRNTHQDAVQPVEEESTVGRMPLEEAGYHALKLYYRRLRKELANLRQVDDADTIHDARVAVRELRAMAALLQPSDSFQRRWLRQIDTGLRQLAHTLGIVRDIDVLLEHLHSYFDQHEGATSGLAWLEEELTRRRARAARRVRKLVKQKETNRLLKKTRRGLQRQHRRIRVSGSATRSTTTTSGGAEEDYPVLVRHFAGGAIWERYQQILRYEMALPRGSAETLHGLRIACKRLRYSMQIFGKTPPALVETLSALKDAQDHLGRLHDIFYAERLITELVPPSGAARRHAPVRTQAATHPHPQYLDYLEALTREGSQLRSGIGPLWRRLTGLPMRQSICGYIASL